MNSARGRSDSPLDVAVKIGGFLQQLISDPETRIRYLDDPARETSDHDVPDCHPLSAKHGLFYRFVSDNEAWTAVSSNDSVALTEAIRSRFPEIDLDSHSEGPIVLTNTFLVHDTLVAAQQVVAALATLKAVAAVTGVASHRT